MEQIVFNHSGKRRAGEKADCLVCGVSFVRRAKEQAGREKKQCCSVACSSELRKRRRLVTCASCEKEFEKRERQLKNSASGLFFCSLACKNAEHRIGGLISPHHYGTATAGVDVYWRVAEAHYPVECVDCGLAVRFALVVHHVDGDRENQSPENLEFVCHQHHAARHMKFSGRTWKYDTKALTPRDRIQEVNRLSILDTVSDASPGSSLPVVPSKTGRGNLQCPVCDSVFHRTPSQMAASKSGIFCCSYACKNLLQRGSRQVEGIELLAHRFKDGVFSYRRRGLRKHTRCANCSIDFKPLLVVHHVDGDRSNGSEENLEVLCFLHHAARHLSMAVNGEWFFSPSALTPRECLVDVLGLLSFNGGVAQREST